MLPSGGHGAFKRSKINIHLIIRRVSACNCYYVMKTSNLRAFSISDSLVLLTFSVRPPTDLFCQALDVGCHFIHGEDGGVTRGGDASKPPQQVGQLRRHRARLVAVKLGQRLWFEVLEHEVGIRPQQLHLHNRFITRETLVSELCVGV